MKNQNCPPGTTPNLGSPGCTPKPKKRAWRKGRKSKTGATTSAPTPPLGRTQTHTDKIAALDASINREVCRRRAITGCCGS